jgi:tetratricopeptide (TPR) repeat protein
MAAHEVDLLVGASEKVERAGKTPSFGDDNDWIRFNDYGIGLVLDGDTINAARAFEAVRDIKPKKRDGNVNLARVALRDGNVEKALDLLAKAEALEPGNALTAYWWGRALQQAGEYERAINAYRRTVEEFPNDRDTLRRLGISYRLNKQYEEALEIFDDGLAIDPEDRTVHYHRMLALRAMGDKERAAIAEQAYEKYNIDESAREWVKEYALKNPQDQLHTQPIFIHDLTAPKPNSLNEASSLALASK